MVQQERARVGWHIQRCECACSWVPGDAVLFRLFYEKSTCTIFRACTTLSDDRPTSAANCYPLHMRLFKFIEKTEWRSIARHLATCVFASLYVLPHMSSLATPRGPAEGYSICTNPSMTVPVATSPRTWPRAHLRRCACSPTRIPFRYSTWPC